MVVARRAFALTLSLLALGCSEDDAPSTSDSQSWTLVMQDLPAALLSVSGRSPTDVWAVGALLDDEALVLHYDGRAWKRVRVGARADLWWVHIFDDGTLYMAGDRGTILKGDGETFTQLQTPDTTSTLYGIWGTAPDAMWAVGTDGKNGIVWRSRDDAFEPAEFDASLLEKKTLFKVWGRQSDEVWMVGDQGAILHFNGDELTPMSSDNHVPLITVNGTDQVVYAVGGLGGSVILQLEGDTWVDATPVDPPALNGVFARDDSAYAVGAFGEVLKREGSGPFLRVETGLDLAREYHAAWIDAAGGVWAVGGHVSDAPLVQGLLSYAGDQAPSGRMPPL